VYLFFYSYCCTLLSLHSLNALWVFRLSCVLQNCLFISLACFLVSLSVLLLLLLLAAVFFCRYSSNIVFLTVLSNWKPTRVCRITLISGRCHVLQYHIVWWRTKSRHSSGGTVPPVNTSCSVRPSRSWLSCGFDFRRRSSLRTSHSVRRQAMHVTP